MCYFTLQRLLLKPLNSRADAETALCKDKSVPMPVFIYLSCIFMKFSGPTRPPESGRQFRATVRLYDEATNYRFWSGETNQSADILLLG